jgi:hypothetical protein
MEDELGSIPRNMSPMEFDVPTTAEIRQEAAVLQRHDHLVEELGQ